MGSGRVRTDDRAYYSEQHKSLLAFCAVKVRKKFGYLVDIEDLMQQCWYDYLRRFPDVGLQSNRVIQWMYRRARESIRNSFFENRGDLSLDYISSIDDHFVDDTDEYLIEKNLLEKMIERLPLMSKTIIRWYLSGLNYTEIGKVVGLSGERYRQIVGEFAENCRVGVNV